MGDKRFHSYSESLIYTQCYYIYQDIVDKLLHECISKIITKYHKILTSVGKDKHFQYKILILLWKEISIFGNS